MDWWLSFLRSLQGWIATRPTSGDELTSRFITRAKTLNKAWHLACEPFLAGDISTVTWQQVEAFPTLVAEIKPTLTPSPVFTSKFCHFLAPRIFPVVDNEGLGNRWASYESYFQLVQAQWDATTSPVRAELADALTSLIEATGTKVFSGFPVVNKIVELRLIGQRHA
jgi:hypothetical protein